MLNGGESPPDEPAESAKRVRTFTFGDATLEAGRFYEDLKPVDGTEVVGAWSNRCAVGRAARWIVGGIDFPMHPIDFVPRPVPDGVDVQWVGKDVDLGALLETGEIDELISADVPRAILEGSPKVARLFEDYEAVERAYYRSSGIFPIMHTVVVARELVEDHPEIVRAVYRGFCDAKHATEARSVAGMTFNNMDTMHPWLTRLIGENRALMGEDWWPYGIVRNRAALDAILRYHHEQGLTLRRLTVEDLFAPGLLET